MNAPYIVLTLSEVFAVGDNLDSWFLNEQNLLWERTNPSLAWLMPAATFWQEDEV